MALAITSFPVPVSPWIRTAESTGETISTNVINARNFGLDPIKSEIAMVFILSKGPHCAGHVSVLDFRPNPVLYRPWIDPNQPPQWLRTLLPI
jgi:hypothetical protein